ncbi:hypothetical protein CFOL_v3_00966, partial [Cephalotus follicularis]
IERMEKTQFMLKQSYGVEEYMLDTNDLCAHPNITFPAKLKMDDVEKFDGSGDPKAYLRQYVRTMKPRGLTKEQLIAAFPRSLIGPTARWYHSQDLKKIGAWKEMAIEFVKQYA